MNAVLSAVCVYWRKHGSAPNLCNIVSELSFFACLTCGARPPLIIRQAYTNHGAHKIVLKLMHQWHSGDPRLLSRSMGRAAGWRATSLLVRGSGGGAARGQDSDPESPRSATDGGDEPPAPLPRDGRQEKDQSPLPPPPPRPPPAAPREPRGGAPPKGAAREKRGAQQQAEVLHAPTVVLVHIEAPWTEGWSYGAYWHDLLHHQSMLALGLYRPVRQQGVQFDCVTTHPCPVGAM
jgi:hypothetical protein